VWFRGDVQTCEIREISEIGVPFGIGAKFMKLVRRSRPNLLMFAPIS
jgi:hypothetical protein